MLVLPYRLPPFRDVASQSARVAALAVALCCVAISARADDKNVVAAASAFEQGQQAELSGNYERAAELFELADRIAPTPEALRSATRARLSAQQLASAAGNAEELLRRYEKDPASRELAEQVLTRAKPELTRFTFQCTDPCTVVVDGLATGVLPLRIQVVYLTPGSHSVAIGFEGDASRGLRLQGSAGEARVIKVARPTQPNETTKKLVAPLSPVAAETPLEAAASASAPPAPVAARARLSPAYFWVASSLTVASGALAIWSGLDLLKARDDFKAEAMPTRGQFEDGEIKDLRTNVLLGTTGVLLLSAVTLAVFTDFRNHAERSGKVASVSSDGHGAQLLLSGRF